MSKDKIPTVAEIVSKIKSFGNSYEDAEELIRDKIEFHVEAALKAAYEKVKIPSIKGCEVNANSILNAYPFDNIK